MNYKAEFSNLVRSFRKRHMGKGPGKIRTTFCKSWAICEMEGNLSPVEKFIATTDEGKQTVRSARTEMVKNMYRQHPPVEMEALLGAKFVDVFVDINIDQDIGMSIFIFDRDLETNYRKTD